MRRFGTSLCALLALLAGSVNLASAQAITPAKALAPDNADTADYVRTTTGLVFHGKIIEETGEQVVLMTKSGPIPFPRKIIAEVHKAGVDYRRPSERIQPVPIPEGKQAQYLATARQHVADGKHEQAVAVCKGLMDLPTKSLSDAQRDNIGKIAAQAYFELKDWKAAAEGLRYAARAIESDVDRNRIQAMAEALAENEPPAIAGQTADNFPQAMMLAMKWKADQIFDDARTFADNPKETHREEGVKRLLQAADARLANAEAYVPGYSVQRWPEICKTLVTQMVAAVEKAAGQCTEDRKGMIRIYWQKVISRRRAIAWNEGVTEYLKLRQAAVDCLQNVQYVEDNHPLKLAYDDGAFKALKEKRANLTKQLQDLKFYHEDAKDLRNRPIRIKGKLIKPVSLSR